MKRCFCNRLKIALINPPFTLEECFKSFARVGSVQQPLGLGYVAATLEQRGHVVKVIDSPALKLSLQETVTAVRKIRPEVIGLTATTPTFHRAVSLAKKIKQEMDIPVIIGGPHPTTLPEDTLAYPFFDIVVVGEGERTMLELIDCLESKRSLNTVRGIAFRERGKVTKTHPREYIENLDNLPFPARHLFPPLRYYHPTPSAYRSLPQATMITSRGCPYSCTFCDHSVFGKRYRARSASNVVDEFEEVVYKYGAKEVRFWDDTFNIDRKRVLAICKEIRERSLEIEWCCLCRANLVDEEMLKIMAQAGCWQIDYGIESGNEELLKGVNKGVTLSQIRKAVEKTKAAGIKVRGFFMLGLPGESERTIRQTIKFAKTLNLDVAVFHIAIPFPGTEFHLQAVMNGEISNEVEYQHYLMFGSNDIPYTPKGLTRKQLLWYRYKAYKSFYLRLSYLLKQLSEIRSLGDVLRYLKGLITISRVE